ncbi:hypothetical protein Nepgr_013529 [Nepenthes gracilis]|uniref:Uncharacterized protein n=1 Tax=Nepenthes gracilis TaxID=150966 RepID=A0AAD3SI18_NEPGR|nr:hypothetical protein Nepgr_013529 [Nepenthes gracilis]
MLKHQPQSQLQAGSSPRDYYSSIPTSGLLPYFQKANSSKRNTQGSTTPDWVVSTAEWVKTQQDHNTRDKGLQDLLIIFIRVNQKPTSQGAPSYNCCP